MASEYDIEIYEEKYFLENFPVFADITDKYLKDYGIDKSKYYFSQCLGVGKWLSVTYGHKEDEDVTVDVTFDVETTQLESIELSKD